MDGAGRPAALTAGRIVTGAWLTIMTMRGPVGVAEALAIFAAAVAAGAINAVVGSGSLITFPTLLAFGIPAVIANVSTTSGSSPAT